MVPKILGRTISVPKKVSQNVFEVENKIWSYPWIFLWPRWSHKNEAYMFQASSYKSTTGYQVWLQPTCRVIWLKGSDIDVDPIMLTSNSSYQQVVWLKGSDVDPIMLTSRSSYRQEVRLKESDIDVDPILLTSRSNYQQAVWLKGSDIDIDPIMLTSRSIGSV